MTAPPALRHLFTLEGLPAATLTDLFAVADSCLDPATGKVRRRPDLAGRIVVNAFFEPSTRTRLSFEIAARTLGAEVVNFDAGSSSAVAKGETMGDTLRVIESLGADLVVIRLASDLGAALGGHEPTAAIINAGAGAVAHPSQGLLDAWTVHRRRGSVAGLVVTVVGDVRHSRVARSLAHAFVTLGATVRFCGPPPWLPDAAECARLGVRPTDDIAVALDRADVVVCLRIQNERHGASILPRPEDYVANYRIDEERLALAAPDALLLHPGPMNRGVEVTSAIADGPRSCVFEQVTNGVAMRMAIMLRLLEARA